MKKIKAGNIALNGILAAVAVILLFLASILPTGRLSLYVLSSFLVSVVIIESGVWAGWMFYISSLLLSLIVVYDKTGIIPYAVFFGIYGIIKYYIEKINNMVLEFILKFVYFNISLGVAIYTVKNIVFGDIRPEFIWIAVVVSEIIFVIYDYVYTLFIGYYNLRLKKIFKINVK